jgi:cytochrome oxidase Cu insertion factor (SCO1/SenC/PrrC family)
MIVLTGTRKQVLAANRAYQSRVEAAMMKNPAESIHHINHTTTIYLQDPQGRIRGLAYHSDPVAAMVDAVKLLANKLPVGAEHGASH